MSTTNKLVGKPPHSARDPNAVVATCLLCKTEWTSLVRYWLHRDIELPFEQRTCLTPAQVISLPKNVVASRCRSFTI